MAVENEKQQEILKVAHGLFWKFGIKRVTVEEICKEAGVSKMTFYKFYANKIDLAKALLDELISTSIVTVKSIIASEIPFSQKLEKMFLMKIEGINNMSMEFINDIYNNPDTGLKDFLEEQQKVSFKIMVEFYIDAQNKGFIRNEVKIDFILAYTNLIVEMMKNETLMSKYNQPQDFIVESMNMLFYGITTGNE